MFRRERGDDARMREAVEERARLRAEMARLATVREDDELRLMVRIRLDNIKASAVAATAALCATVAAVILLYRNCGT
jgi:hypothetical protein